MGSPFFSSSIPVACHPKVALCSEQANAYTIQTLKSPTDAQKLKVVKSNIPLCACLMIPNCNTLEKMLLISKYFNAVVFLDDVLEVARSQEEAQAIINLALNTEESSMVKGPAELELLKSTPFLTLFMETINELRDSMSETLFARHLASMKRTYEAVVRESELHRENVIPSKKEFARLRPRTTYIEPCGAVIGEFAEDIELQQSDLDLPEYSELVDAVCNHVGLANDLLSFKRDCNSKTWHNWLHVLLHENAGRMTLEDAVQEISKEIENVEDQILSLQKKLLAIAAGQNNIPLTTFATSFPLVASGHLKYCYMSERYTSLNPALIRNMESYALSQVLDKFSPNQNQYA